MRGGSQGIDRLVIPIILQQVASGASRFAPQAQKYADILYATAIGTSIGIGSNPTIRGSYELWKGTNRSNEKARQERWYNRTLRRRFKGDVLVDEGTNTQQETYFPDKPINRVSVGSGYNNFSFSSRRRTKRPTARRRRCNCQSMLRRILGKPRFSKRRRKLHRNFV